MASSPASLVKLASCSWPTTEGEVWPAWVTCTWPLGEMVTSVASCGIEICGCTW